MKKSFVIYLIFIIFIALASCENLSDPGENEYRQSAFINLRTGNTVQKFYIYKSLPINYEFKAGRDGSSEERMAEEVFSSEARMMIQGGGVTYAGFKIESEGDTLYRKRYFTNTEKFFINPKVNYKIKIEAEDNVISGEVRAIGDFQIIKAEAEDSEGRKFSVWWNKAENARYYRIRALTYITSELPPIGKIKDMREKDYILDPDTVKGSGLYSQLIEFDSGRDSSRIIIEACDINLYNYYIRKIKRVNIDNAYGFMGSSAVGEIYIP